VIDLETVHGTREGTWFHRAIAVLLGLIAVLAATLGAVQMDRSQAETRAATQAARLTADLAAGIPIQGIGFTLSATATQAALLRMAEGTTREFLASTAGDQVTAAAGAAEQAAGQRLVMIAGRMGATPDATSGLPAYELRLMDAGMDDLQTEVKEQNRLVDVTITAASTDSNLTVAGLSVLALSGVLVGLASVLGADRAGRATLVVAWLAALAAAALLASALL
jgi:hypothetical protein